MKNKMVRTAGIFVVTLFFVSLAAAQALTPEPDVEMNTRFSRVLGVDVNKVAQHYYLVKNGGVIELSAKDANDTATIAAIRKYLDSQKDLFEKGKNDTDAEVHGKVPDGLAAIKKFRNEINFFTAKTDNGAVLRMFTVNDQARQAIHDYLKFQIAEHKTGDSPTVDQ